MGIFQSSPQPAPASPTSCAEECRHHLQLQAHPQNIPPRQIVCVQCTRFSPSGHHLLVSVGGHVHVYSLQHHGYPVTHVITTSTDMISPTEAVTCMEFSVDGSLLVLGTWGGYLLTHRGEGYSSDDEEQGCWSYLPHPPGTLLESLKIDARFIISCNTLVPHPHSPNIMAAICARQNMRIFDVVPPSTTTNDGLRALFPPGDIYSTSHKFYRCVSHMAFVNGEQIMVHSSIQSNVLCLVTLIPEITIDREIALHSLLPKEMSPSSPSAQTINCFGLYLMNDNQTLVVCTKVGIIYLDALTMDTCGQPPLIISSSCMQDQEITSTRISQDRQCVCINTAPDANLYVVDVVASPDKVQRVPSIVHPTKFPFDFSLSHTTAAPTMASTSLTFHLSPNATGIRVCVYLLNIMHGGGGGGESDGGDSRYFVTWPFVLEDLVGYLLPNCLVATCYQFHRSIVDVRGC